MAAIKESFSGNAKTVQYAEGRKKLCARMWNIQMAGAVLGY